MWGRRGDVHMVDTGAWGNERETMNPWSWSHRQLWVSRCVHCYQNLYSLEQQYMLSSAEWSLGLLNICVLSNTFKLYYLVKLVVLVLLTRKKVVFSCPVSSKFKLAGGGGEERHTLFFCTVIISQPNCVFSHLLKFSSSNYSLRLILFFH